MFESIFKLWELCNKNKRNRFITLIIWGIIVFTLALWPWHARAMNVTITGDPANHATYLAQLAQDVESVSNQVRQLQYEAQNVENLSVDQSSDILSAYSRLKSLKARAQALGWEMESAQEQYETQYKTASTSKWYAADGSEFNAAGKWYTADGEEVKLSDLYKQWNANLQEQSREALYTTNAAMSSQESQAAQAQAILKAAQSAGGIKAVLQASVQMSGLLSAQLAELKALSAASNRMQVAATGQSAAQTSQNQAAMESLTSGDSVLRGKSIKTSY